MLDLAEVDFLDSMGLRTLLAVAKHSRVRKRKASNVSSPGLKSSSVASRVIIRMSSLPESESVR